MISNERIRNIKIDIIRGIAIFFMVFGHCIQYGSGFSDESFFEDVIFKCIYTFHMPLFMLISGYLFYNTYSKYKSSELIKTRLIKLIMPIFTWTALHLIIIYLVEGIVITDFLKQYITACFSSLWFLWAIFYSSLIIIIVSYTKKFSYIIWMFIFIFTFIITDSYNLVLYKYVYPYFVLGFLYHKHRDKLMHLRQILCTPMGICFQIILYTISYYCFSRETYIYTSGLAVYGKLPEQLLQNMLRFFIGLQGSILLIIVVNKIFDNCYNNKIIKYSANLFAVFGKYSMGIYIISGYITYRIFFPIKEMLFRNYLLNLFEAFAITMFSLIISYIFKKFWITKLLFFGEKGYKNRNQS